MLCLELTLCHRVNQADETAFIVLVSEEDGSSLVKARVHMEEIYQRQQGEFHPCHGAGICIHIYSRELDAHAMAARDTGALPLSVTKHALTASL